MKKLFIFICFAFPVVAFAEGESGKIQICRHPTITSSTDKYKVVLQDPIYFKKYQQNYNGDSDYLIEIDHEIKLNAKPSCIVTTGTVIRKTGKLSPPKKGSIWRADANAKPGQHWGKSPKVTSETIDNIEYTTTEYEPSKGGEIQSVSLRGRILEDFK